MGKGKKRPRVDLNQVNQLSNITGFGGSNEESMDDLMAQMQQSATAPLPKDDKKQEKVASKSEGASSSPSKPDNSKPSSVISSELMTLDQIESWNRSFLAWSKGGSYTPGLLPCVDEELARNFKVQELSVFLLKSFKDIRMPVFERWFIDSKVQERQDYSPHQSDPVLPHSASPHSEPSKRLVEELCHEGASEDDAEKAVAELCRRNNVAVQELSSQAQRYKSQATLKKGDRIVLEDKDTTVVLLYSRKKWRKPFLFKLNKGHYQKLRDRFLQIHNQTTTKMDLLDNIKNKGMHAFHLLLLSLLLRYSALSGGQLLQDLRGGGMQGSIHEQVFDVLRSTLEGPWLEGFASPFNVYLPTFASAFPEVEWHFGSVGNFMDSSFTQGCCEVNPPFSPGLMNAMVDHIENQLAKADQADLPLTFAVIVPTANKKGSVSEVAVAKQAAAVSFRRMVSSPTCRHHVVLAAREHGYVEGAQHLRPTKYKQSVYDTSVILLQSAKARDQKVDLQMLEKDLISAFASRHADELEQRKKNAVD
jgi:phosphorylated CTD-interacting factor 1